MPELIGAALAGLVAIALPIFFVFVSYFAVGYDSQMILGVTPPWFVQLALAMIGFRWGWSIPLAIVLWLLHFIPGVHFPMVRS